ncbi:unnamed protein product [Mytilus coruscus]|uniref:Uncharacterized protein n=1 Tax=Mytilus coruscus TaxID=42192 RepID=A0A6J8EAK4_MYTCO|nr:unnamed protein product [Mytilus coruscus]
MPRRKNWRAAEAKRGVKNPKKQRLTNLTGNTGPINSIQFDLDMGDTDTLNKINLSHNQNEQSELNQNELSELNQLELPELNQLELSELNQLELPELNQLELSELNELELPELNQNSYNTYAKETSHSSHKQTNILSNQSKNSYAKKDSPSMILTDLLQNQKCTLNNPLDYSGKSNLIGFSDLHDLVSYLYAFYTSLKIDLDSLYEILPVCISSKDTETELNKQTKNYFEDQKLRNTKLKKNRKRDKENLLLKDRLKVIKISKKKKELAAKRETRKDEDFRKAEAESKKSQRNNSDLRQKERQRELASKREARKNQDFKKRELASKRETRKDIDFKKREIASKRETRKDEDFKKRELDSKRETRKKDEFKRNEAETKKIARQDEEYRKHVSKRDYHRKQDYRSNPENLENKRLAKRSSRRKNFDKDRSYNHTEQEDNRGQNDSDDDSDRFSEVDENETHVGNTDTLFDYIPDDNPPCDTGLTFAPGEGQRPISLYSDPDAEYLSFPTIFCGQRRPDNKDRSVSVHYTYIVKRELRSMDRRIAQSVPNIFFKLQKIQLKNINDKVNLALRRCQSDGKKWTAKDVLNPNTVNDIVRLNEENNTSLDNLQVHKHSKTCRKKGHPICRFGFPLPPMKETVILEPLKENDDIEKYKVIYKEVQNEINSLHNSEDIDQMTYDMFLDDVLQMNDENYIKAIRSNLSGPNVFLKRKPSEVRVNGYMC